MGWVEMIADSAPLLAADVADAVGDLASVVGVAADERRGRVVVLVYQENGGRLLDVAWAAVARLSPLWPGTFPTPVGLEVAGHGRSVVTDHVQMCGQALVLSRPGWRWLDEIGCVDAAEGGRETTACP